MAGVTSNKYLLRISKIRIRDIIGFFFIVEAIILDFQPLKLDFWWVLRAYSKAKRPLTLHSAILARILVTPSFLSCVRTISMPPFTKNSENNGLENNELIKNVSVAIPDVIFSTL